MRTAAAAVVAAAGAVLAAQILGEYQFDGWRPLAMGGLAGLAFGELVVAVGGGRSRAMGAAAALAAAVTLVWAGAVSVQGRGEPVPAGAWWGAAVGAGAAWLRAGERSRGSGTRRPP